MTTETHHRNCYQTRGIPQSLLDEGAPATLCDCKTLWMIDGFEFDRRTTLVTEWGIRISDDHVLTVNTVPITDDVLTSQVKAMAASGIVGELVSCVRTHTDDVVTDWTTPAPTAGGKVDTAPEADDDGYDDGLCECGRYGAHLVGCPADTAPESGEGR